MGGVCPSGAGGSQECLNFFSELFSWGTRFVASDHRLSAFWLYVSRDAWVALNGFDEGFQGYGCDDTDLCLRAWKLRQPIRIDRACYVEHQAASSYEKSTNIDALRNDSIGQFIYKHKMTLEMYTIPLRLMDYGEDECK
jgi:GT2 family glycosyltransferase